MEGGGDSRFVRDLVSPTLAPALVPTQQALRALSSLQIIQGLGVARPEQLPQTSSGQHRIMPIVPQARRWRPDGSGTVLPVASLPVNQVRAISLVINTFMVATMRRQEGPLYHNAGVHPTVALAPPTTQVLAMDNSMPATVEPVTNQRIINHDVMRFMRETPDIRGLPGIVSPVAVHGNGNQLSCIYCGLVFALRSSEIPGFLPRPGFSYPEPIGPPSLLPSLTLAGDASRTAVACSDPHHFIVTMQHMPKQEIADLIRSSDIPSIHIPSAAGGHGGQHVGTAPSLTGMTGATASTVNHMQMPAIHMEQNILPPTMLSSSASPEGITSTAVPLTLNMMPMQDILRDQLSLPPTTSSSSTSGVLCEYVMPEHEDMVCLTLGQSSTMDLDLSL
uniref:Uncharacterized protein n=1 Tax=Oryza punctata TaxID=4537 RepID=A0A0E0LYY3_ORYPU